MGDESADLSTDGRTPKKVQADLQPARAQDRRQTNGHTERQNNREGQTGRQT